MQKGKARIRLWLTLQTKCSDANLTLYLDPNLDNSNPNLYPFTLTLYLDQALDPNFDPDP